MFNKTKIYGSLAGLGFFLALTTNSALAQKKMEVEMPASAVGLFHSQKKLGKLK